jgi:hypothetical protein
MSIKPIVREVARSVVRSAGSAVKTPFSWSSYWATQPEVLFFGLYSEITGGQMPNKVTGATDYLTVAGVAGSETYTCPNTVAYKSADTDSIWFYNSGSNQVVTTADLIAYDFTRTIVKYADATPYAIEAIMILKSDIAAGKVNRLHKDFWLSIYWSNVYNDSGHLKDNKPATARYVYPLPWASIVNANTIGWFPLDDTSLITQVGGLVSKVTDKLGGAMALNQAGADNIKPTYANGILTFDGIRQLMTSGAIVWNQPEMIYMVVNQLTWTLSDYIFDGNGNSLGAVYQTATTPGLKGYAGGASAQNNNLPTNTWAIMTVQFLSNYHRLQINDTTVTAWTSGLNNMGGLTLGVKGTLLTGWSNVAFKEIICRNLQEYGLATHTAIKAYLKQKYNITY